MHFENAYTGSSGIKCEQGNKSENLQEKVDHNGCTCVYGENTDSRHRSHCTCALKRGYGLLRMENDREITYYRACQH